MSTPTKPQWTDLQLQDLIAQFENNHNHDESYYDLTWEEYSQKRWEDYCKTENRQRFASL